MGAPLGFDGGAARASRIGRDADDEVWRGSGRPSAVTARAVMEASAVNGDWRCGSGPDGFSASAHLSLSHTFWLLQISLTATRVLSAFATDC
nr:hypothetical protein Itr_chr04CG17550 [Ipomoea trifida]GMC80021.1 hypothetical protein Iba_chr04aCG16420 [Ipomoea batatas]GMD74866.1 hypothetical protein Iba_chr13aCG9410 [Ipomoea batatas]